MTAPPYDVIDAADRSRLASLDPHNIVHLTLNDSEDEAGGLYRDWLAEGVLDRESDPAVWVVRQEYVGPDGVARSREGVVASLRVEPYEAGVVLPHERTHAGPKESRLRLLRATRCQLEPIFLLYDGAPPLTPPERVADLAAEGTALWRLDADVGEFFRDRPLLIADGHHRYETALAYAEETGCDRMMVVLVSTSDEGLEVFPTHRVFARELDVHLAGEPVEGVEQALHRLEEESHDSAAAILYTADSSVLVRGALGELDVELVDAFGHEGISYTPDAAEAVRRVDEGEAGFAFLLRATPIDAVFERARRGLVMPQKTTYFFPKLTSGLLLHPVDA